MSSLNVSQLTAITAAGSAAGDQLYLFDVSATGSARSKSITRAEAEKMFTRHHVPINAPGDLVDEASYGYFKARIACKIVGLDFALGDLPVGANLTFDLTKAGVEQTLITTVQPSDAGYGQTIFGTALTLAAGDIIRLKVKSVGSTSPGAYLQANLIIEPASG